MYCLYSFDNPGLSCISCCAEQEVTMVEDRLAAAVSTQDQLEYVEQVGGCIKGAC